MPPSLKGAYLRVQRAGTHLSDLERRERRRNRAYRKNLIYEFNRVTQLAHGRWKGSRPISPGISVVLGEVIYNLRAALDYLVYELAFLDSGLEQDGTQFPIESSKGGFASRCDETRDRGVYLRGLSQAHKDAIKDLQPCYGCHWTKLLADISNPDKHRKLTDSHGEVEVTIRLEYGRAIDFAGLPGKVFYAQGRFPRWHKRRGQICDVYVYGDFTIEVTFSDRTPVIATLEFLKSQVASTLDAFNPEF